MQPILLNISLVFFCSTLICYADLSGSSFVANVIISGCWSGKILKSLWEDRPVSAGVPVELPAQWSSVEINFLRYNRRFNRQNHDQVSALFTEEGKYER